MILVGPILLRIIALFINYKYKFWRLDLFFQYHLLDWTCQKKKHMYKRNQSTKPAIGS
jgi:hypothetical protein